MRATIYHIVFATDFNLRTLAGESDDHIPAEADLAAVEDTAPLLELAYHRFDELSPMLRVGA